MHGKVPAGTELPGGSGRGVGEGVWAGGGGRRLEEGSGRGRGWRGTIPNATLSQPE